ncbi:hypothetical protein DDB_G0271768 [Dictyostelium discoideum AX4]|uniref:Uncharacterized protein n=1 Tax=Dictyostelium discoideum TaxID=44689 RepID=Q55AK5_DICDI|nr:hypothetical protein DDB_G0271768 [Dictyostelium discoideum AX4]EAL71574.1 hypothetical protein DDB_G0271768 [Dictyostelium discoideum AX4]|eukprot:XP_645517.1 hypothetical protein DDB_G0271768 [Dictyostelium discoideum AX4]
MVNGNINDIESFLKKLEDLVIINKYSEKGLKEQVLDIKSQILEFKNNNKIIYPNRWDLNEDNCLIEIEKGGRE